MSKVTDKVALAIAGFIKLRDQKEAVKKKHQEELEPLNAKMQTIEGWLYYIIVG